MNKGELVTAVAERTELNNATATAAVDAVFDAITAALSEKDDVRLLGFGTFAVSHRKAREGRNPQTGEKIAIKASNHPSFKPGKALKDAVN